MPSTPLTRSTVSPINHTQNYCPLHGYMKCCCEERNLKPPSLQDIGDIGRAELILLYEEVNSWMRQQEADSAHNAKMEYIQTKLRDIVHCTMPYYIKRHMT